MVATLLACLLLGGLGRALKPVVFLALVAPALAAVAVLAVWRGDVSGLAAAGLFYASLTVAEFAYLGALLVDARSQLEPDAGSVGERRALGPAQDRRA